MRTYNLAVASCLWLSLSAGAATAQQADWQENKTKGHAALQSGNLDEANQYLQKALKSAEQQYGPDDSRLPALLTDLAATCEAQKNYAQAEELLKRVISIFGQDIGKQTPDSADQMVKLAKLYQREGKTAEAEGVLEQALPIYERWHNGNNDLYNEGIATVLDTLGSLYSGDGKFDKAEPLFKRALTIRESIYGIGSVEVGQTLQNYADMLRKTNRLAEADKLSDRAKTIQSQP